MPNQCVEPGLGQMFIANPWPATLIILAIIAGLVFLYARLMG